MTGAESPRSIEVRCLGPVGVIANGQPVPLSAEQRLLVSILVAAGPAGIDKERLFDELLGDSVRKTGDHTVVMRLQRLRKKIADQRVITKGPRYSLDPAACAVDVWEWEADADSTSTRRVRRSLAEWREPFGDSPAQPPVVVATAERLRRCHRRAVAQLGAIPGDELDGEVLAHAVDVASMHLDDETLVAAVARALYRQGRQPEALGIIARSRAELLERHGLDPGPDLCELELRILRHDVDPPATEARPDLQIGDRPIGEDLAAPLARFVGREEQLTILRRSVSAITAPTDASNRRFVELRGGAGSGKTSLLSEVLAPERRRNDPDVATLALRVGRGARDDDGPAADSAYATIMTALPEIRAAVDDALRSPIPEIGRIAVLQQAQRTLASLASMGPTVVVIDDVHGADAQSQWLLAQLASASIPANALVVAATRLPFIETGTHQLLELEPFSRLDLAALVERDHPSETAVARDRFVERLFELSAGEPFVAAVLSRDAPRGLDVTLLPDSIGASDALDDHLTAKVDDEELRQLLAVAALAGTSFDPDLVRRVIGLPAERVAGLLEQARMLGVCRQVDVTSWQFDHPLTAGHFSRSIALLRPLVFARLAREASDHDPSMVRYVIGARHELDATTAVERLLDTGRSLEAEFAFNEAVTAFEAAADRMDIVDERRLDTLVSLATCAARAGRRDDARLWRQRAFELAEARGHAGSMLRAALAGLPSAEVAAGERDRLDMLERVAERHAIDDDPTVARLHIRHSRLCDRPATARRIIDALPSEMLAGNDDETLLLRGEVLSFRHTEDARLIGDSMYSLAEASSSGSVNAVLLHRSLVASIVEQRPEATGSLLAEAGAAARAAGSPRTRWSHTVAVAALSAVEASEEKSDAEVARRSGVKWGIPDAFDTWGVQVWFGLWLQGDHAAGLHLIDDHRRSIAMNVAWSAAESYGAAATGDDARARSLAGTVARHLDREPVGLWNPVAAAMLAETSALLDDVEAARAARDVLGKRSGQAVVLGTGVAHLGPVDRYLAITARVLGAEEPEPLLRRAAQQARAAGTELWARRIDRELEPGTDPALPRRYAGT